MYKHRFAAKIQLKEDTFVKEGDFEGLAVLNRTGTQGHIATNNGIATSIKYAGNWKSTFAQGQSTHGKPP